MGTVDPVDETCIEVGEKLVKLIATGIETAVVIDMIFERLVIIVIDRHRQACAIGRVTVMGAVDVGVILTDVIVGMIGM